MNWERQPGLEGVPVRRGKLKIDSGGGRCPTEEEKFRSFQDWSNLWHHTQLKEPSSLKRQEGGGYLLLAQGHSNLGA